MLFKPMPDHRMAVKAVPPPGGQTTFRSRAAALGSAARNRAAAAPRLRRLRAEIVLVVAEVPDCPSAAHLDTCVGSRRGIAIVRDEDQRAG